MQFKPLFNGQLVRLAASQTDDAEHFARWSQNDDYLRMLDNDPAKPLSPDAYSQWEQSFWNAPNTFAFRLRTLADDQLIGLVVLGDVQWMHGTAMLGIAIGDPAYWDKGYGTDAMRVILRYGFNELNLYRVTSNTMGYNIRSMKAHEKAGFQREGVQRQSIQREGQRYDVIYYGILREEWLAQQNTEASR
jgi:RimJ/RimL family protein N-acetyltransferase